MCSFSSFFLPASRQLKLQAWSSGILCRLQKTSSHLHSMPNSPTFFLHVKHLDLSAWIKIGCTCLGSGTGGWEGGRASLTSGSSSFFEFLREAYPFLFLRRLKRTYSRPSTASQMPRSRRSSCRRHKASWQTVRFSLRSFKLERIML